MGEIGIAKGNEALLGQVNAFLDDFRKQDGFGKLGECYLQKEKIPRSRRGSVYSNYYGPKL